MRSWGSDLPSDSTSEVVGARPTWVCEILSSNRNHDLIFKRRVLHAARVPFYWTMDLDAPLLTVLRYHEEGHLIAMTVQPGDRASLPPFDAVELEVRNIFGDIEF
jgi:hypothetical protein